MGLPCAYEETAASMEELTNTVAQNAENTRQANRYPASLALHALRIENRQMDPIETATIPGAPYHCPHVSRPPTQCAGAAKHQRCTCHSKCLVHIFGQFQAGRPTIAFGCTQKIFQ